LAMLVKPLAPDAFTLGAFQGALEEKERLLNDRRRIRELELQMKASAQRAAEAARYERLKARTDETCKKLQGEILLMKQQKVALARAVSESHKEMNAYKRSKEKELAQVGCAVSGVCVCVWWWGDVFRWQCLVMPLVSVARQPEAVLSDVAAPIQARRAGMKSAAELQRLSAMHDKQQQVLKRKTEEAEAARRRLREMGSSKSTARKLREAMAATLARQDAKTEQARREWVEKELEACNLVGAAVL